MYAPLSLFVTGGAIIHRLHCCTEKAIKQTPSQPAYQCNERQGGMSFPVGVQYPMDHPKSQRTQGSHTSTQWCDTSRGARRNRLSIGDQTWRNWTQYA